MTQERSLKKTSCMLLALCVIGAILVLPGAHAASKTPAAEKPRYGGVLKILTSYSVVNLGCPWERYIPTDNTFRHPAVEVLLRVDENGFPVPWLATAWKFSPDRKQLTLTLRKGVKFHDGTDFNAEAAKYVLDQYRTSPVVGLLKQVTSVDIVDPYSVRLNLAQFEAHILNSLAQVYVVSPTAVKAMGNQKALTNAVGTGPFKQVSFQRDVSLKYEKFAGYWQKGKPYLDGIEFNIIADRVTAQMAFKTGQGQMIDGINPKDAADLKETGKYVITMTPSACYGIAGDSGKPKSPFADVRVRQAVDHAINKEAIAKSLGYGFFRAANQPAAPGRWVYNTAIAGYPYNPKKAKELLKEAGYPSGFQTRIVIQTTTARDPFIAMQADLAQVGIDAKLEIVTPASHTQMQIAGWDNALMYYHHPTGVGQDPGQTMQIRLSTKSGQWSSIIHPPDFEAKLAQANGEPDMNKRKSMLQELMKLAVDKYCMANIVYAANWLNAKTPDVRDARFSEIWFQQWTPEDTWLAK